MVKQTAGRDALTGFADDFARYNDDVYLVRYGIIPILAYIIVQ